MELVNQRRRRDCAIACLAMVTNTDYDSVMEESGIDPEIGAYRWQWLGYLKKQHYHGKWRDYKPSDILPEPWAAVHLCSYQTKYRNLNHMVVVYQGNTVFDPNEAKTRSYSTLHNVRCLISIYPPYFMQPRSFSEMLGKK